MLLYPESQDNGDARTLCWEPIRVSVGPLLELNVPECQVCLCDKRRSRELDAPHAASIFSLLYATLLRHLNTC